MTTHQICVNFAAPTTELQRKERERERIAACADRNAAHYAEILKSMDDEIKALRDKEAKNVKSDVQSPQIAQTAVISRLEPISQETDV